RRHTRSDRDWSSDVCSSDLSQFAGMPARNVLGEHGTPPWRNAATASFLPSDNHDLSLTALTTAGQQKWVQEMGRVNNYTSFALRSEERRVGKECKYEGWECS